MHHFHYADGQLLCEETPLADIAASVGTPTYVYATATLERHYRVLEQAVAGLDAVIAYAVKANGNLGVLATLARLGAGADIVSGGELHRAVAAGIPPERIVFSGSGKSQADIDLALETGISLFNVESGPELLRIAGMAAARNVTAPVAFRVNPDIEAGAHHHIRTGRADDKFGVPWQDAPSLYATAASLTGVKVVGIHMHIGSQIADIAPMRDAFTRLSGLIGQLRKAGHCIEVIDLGGGLAIPYAQQDHADSPAMYGQMIRNTLDAADARIVLEPGRVIVGNAGILLSRVEYVKTGPGRAFVILDAGMNDLLRPALYSARHDHQIWPANQPRPDGRTMVADVVGPVCESADTFAVDRTLPELRQGDLVAIMSAGAYGASMSSRYNGRALTAEVLVSGRSYCTVRERVEDKDTLCYEHIPCWTGRGT